MPKILIINSCERCPYARLNDMRTVAVYCGKFERHLMTIGINEIPSWCPLEEEDNKLRAVWFKKGQMSVKRKNKSGCTCIIDDNDEVVSVCGAHEAWMEEEDEKNKLPKM